MRIRVTDGAGAAVPDSMVEIWQADGDGQYPGAAAGRPDAEPPVAGYGRLPTNDEGVCEFETVKPGRVSDGEGGWQAAHINLCLSGRGLLRHIHTRLYFAGDPALSGDAVLRLVPEARRVTLLARKSAGLAVAQWEFHIRLQGENETVFFDL